MNYWIVRMSALALGCCLGLVTSVCVCVWNQDVQPRDSVEPKGGMRVSCPWMQARPIRICMDREIQWRRVGFLHPRLRVD